MHQLVEDGSFASGWVIARRYSEFFALHQKLKERFNSIVRHYELPGKRGFLKLQKSFVESRRIGLERYLQLLVQHIEICQSQELRAFLSQENVALPQFSVAPSSSTFLPYGLFDIDGFGKQKNEKTTLEHGTGGDSGLSSPQPVQNQHFFEQLFHSSSSQPRALLEVQTGGSNSALRSLLPQLPSGDADSLPIDPNEGFMKHIYQTVSEGLDDMFSGGPPTVLGNITKQLGNQMMQFSIEDDDSAFVHTPRLEEQDGIGSSEVVLPNTLIINRDRTGTSPSSPSLNEWSDGSQSTLQPNLQRDPSFRARRISSPDPHTHHQRQQLQKQEQQRQQQVHDQTQEQHQQQQQQSKPKQPPVRPAVVEPEGVTTFTEPLCDLFIELFELKEKNNWLRRQAVVIILQQVLGGTIERKLRDTIKGYLEETMLTYYVFKLKDALWPHPEPSHYSGDTAGSGRPGSLNGSSYLSGGYEVIDQNLGLPPSSPGPAVTPDPHSIHETGASTASPGTVKRPAQQRSAEQKAVTKDQANRKLSAFLPELLGNMVGHQNARRGARRVFAAFQNRRLNQQLVYTALDEIVGAMWPELAIVDQPDAQGVHRETVSSSSVVPVL